MFGMITNKSRRLLRRASTRENLLRKQKEREILEEETGEMSGGKGKLSPFSVISQRYAVDISDTGDLECLSEEKHQNIVSGDVTSRHLIRSSSCTNVFFGRQASGFSPLNGSLTRDRYPGASETGTISVEGRYGNSQTLQHELVNCNSHDSVALRTCSKVVQDQNVVVGRGSCTDLSHTFLSGEDSERQGGRPRLGTFPSETGATHRIGLRLEMTLPGIKTGVKTNTVSRETDTRQRSSPDPTASVGKVNTLENKQDCEEVKSQPHDKQHHNDNHTNHPNKTLLRSRSCSFIVSLSYHLKDSINAPNTGDTRKCNHSDTLKYNSGGGSTFSYQSNINFDVGKQNCPTNDGTNTSVDEVTQKSQENSKRQNNSHDTPSESNRSQRPVRHFRRLFKSRSLLHFAGFTKDAHSGKVKNDPVSSGRKSTIIENDGDNNDEDRFDDIFGEDKNGSIDVGTENNVSLCPSSEIKGEPFDSKENINQICGKTYENKEINSKCLAELDGINSKDETNCNVTKPETQSGCKSRCENPSLNLVEPVASVNLENSHEDHKCANSDCRQCQFLSQFVVPEQNLDSSSSSGLRNKPRNPRNQRKNIFGKKASTSALKAIYLPTINLQQEQGGKGMLQRDRSRDVSGRNSSFLERRAIFSTEKSSLDAGLPPQTIRSQPHQPKPPHPPRYKKPSTFQARISTLTKALGIFAKKNDMTVEKPSKESEFKAKDRGTINLSEEYVTSNVKGRPSDKRQPSVDELCIKFGFPYSKRVIAPKPPHFPCSESVLKKSPKCDEDRVEDKGHKTPPEGKHDKMSSVSTEVGSSSRTRRVPISPSLSKPHNRISSDRNYQGKNRKLKLLRGNSKQLASFEEHKEDIPSHRAESTRKDSLGNSRRRRNVANSGRAKVDLNKPSKKPDTNKVNRFSKSQEESYPTAFAQEVDPSLALAPNGFQGFYNVLPPIEPIQDDDNLRHQLDTANQVPAIEEVKATYGDS
ncbi:hypothetical protein ElyMa_000133600 [Elysia marginata]|uniref:Uncharacterized protein n=1 Tax=Elysia marginata TaxID=1093978 RepID=A0AAV4EQ05_9GAST|nr:hypothetical protein ElyMa_000133600 [Elysia marginata]